MRPATDVYEPAPQATAALLRAFLTGLRDRVPLRALWAHGSLAGGDYQEGRSDLDLIAFLARPATPQEADDLAGLHRRLAATGGPAARSLHCAYLDGTAPDDPAHLHLAWAHEELMHRQITPVTRRELHTFGRVLYGEDPAALLPPVTDDQLTAFVLADLRGFWRPALGHPEYWLRDIWVDLGLLTLARATVTLRNGTLISKRRALPVLAGLGAPTQVLADIRHRRYGPAPASPDAPPSPDAPGAPDAHRADWPVRRAELTRAFLAPAIDRTLAAYGSG
ncbi:nucleotidyltransferase domain-containing protein [Streptomyces sp. CB02959]|uniref:nucleotidyltransferase domain-containing protein n=1 Tax=Streptomyces sp. CB02959 TaxID=2020330 RepID=UPI000D1BDD90|nr:nucleotidyltransferase domain-containing protein [Streptomyces sp. CB02959]